MPPCKTCNREVYEIRIPNNTNKITIICTLLNRVEMVEISIQSQFVGSPGSIPSPTGFEIHGSACYRYISMAARWTDAWTICRTMSADLVSIESEEENQYLTNLVKNETLADGAKDTDTLAERIWTSGANFNGQLTWVATRTPITYSSWHRGEPYVTTLRDVFCVMKMADDWYSDQCKHERKFVCEKQLDGIVMPYVPSGGTEQPKPTDLIQYTKSDVLAVG